MQNPENAAIHSILNELAEAYRERHLERYLACLSPEAFVIGTGADERCDGLESVRAHLERDWAQSEKAAFVLESAKTVAHLESSWVAADCRFQFRVQGEDASLPGRASFFLGKTGGQWKIEHAHFSIPASAQPEGQSLPM